MILVDLAYFQAGNGAAAATLPADLAVLLGGVAARQATSPTALIQARLEVTDRVARDALAASGAFHAATARLLRGGRQE